MLDRHPELRTDRLRLRRWRESDLDPFAALNADARVARFLSGPLDREASDRMVIKIESAFDRDGYGLFAVERLEDAAFLGFIGLSRPNFDASFMPCVEIGWRLAPDAWGRGYATEGALAVRDFGFDVVGLDEIVSFTAVPNEASRHVMEKIGLRHDPDSDFQHPRMAEGHPLRSHVLYRLRRDDRV